jgi:hypothetical protein
LSQTDNSTAAGWLRKSNIQLSTARKLATLLIESKSCIYSQWFSGEENSISDSLSRDFHINSTQLCNLLSSNFPFQAPFGLKIHPLPKEIVSWVTSLLQFHPQQEQWSKELARSEFARGIGIRDDDYLDSFDRSQKHKILSTFAQSIREGHFGHKPSKFLKSDSVRASLDGMAQTFRLAGRSDPRLDAHNKLAFLLQ